MKIPKNTLSATQFRTYGAGGFSLEDQEAEQGCPRRYKAQYVDGVVDEGDRYPLLYGQFFHRVLYLLEEGRTPDEALAEAFDPRLPQEAWTEARTDLDRYLERGATPTDLYATIGNELDLKAVLYEDEEFGTVYYRGIIDWVGLDLDDPRVFHLVDYKTNRSPAAEADLRGDVQMRGYHWLLLQNRERWTSDPIRVVTHYDAVKFREVVTAYTDDEIEDWHSWAVAVARAILRDEEAEPRLNKDCPYCPVRDTCPLFQALPDSGRALSARGAKLEDPEALVAWREEANATRLMLEKAVRSADQKLGEHVYAEGELVAGGFRFSLEQSWSTVIDSRKLHEAMGDAFYLVAAPTQAGIDRVTGGWDTNRIAAVKAAIERVPGALKVSKKKAAKRKEAQ